MQPETRTTVTQQVVRRELLYTRTMTIGRVTKLFSNGWVEVDPQIQMVERNNKGEETPKSIGVLSRIPVGLFKAGGFILTLPIAVGDEGIILFSDRGLSLWKETGKKAPPRETEFHGLSGAVFVPFPTSKAGAIQGFDANGLYAGMEDQSAYLRVGKAGDVRIFGDTKITLDSPLVEATGAVTMASTLYVAGDTTLDANVVVELETFLRGAVNTESTVTSTGNHFAPAFIET